MRIGIYGLGVVGGALANYLKSRKHDVKKKDPELGLNDSLVPTPDAVFICVPIPTKGFNQDLSIVETILDEWRGSEIPIFLRSTALPGTADGLSAKYNCNVVSCPEFLTERHAESDMARLPILYGHHPKGPNIWNRHLKRTIDSLFQDHEKWSLSNAECELAKFAHNCFGAMKVTFFNGIYEQCDRLGLRYESVLSGVLASGHINKTHTQVPGPDGKKGYGGKCFPANMEAFIGFLKSDIFGKLLLDSHCMNRFYRDLKSSDQRPKHDLDV